MAGMKTMRGASAQLGPRLQWEARRIATRLGWSGIVTAGALVLAALAVWQAKQLNGREQQLQQQLRAAQLAAARPAPVVLEGAAANASQLAAFYALLPKHEMIPDLLKQLVAVADKNGVTLAKADYKALPDDNADFIRYQITLPIKADYAKVQAFLVAALHALPTLTLDAVAFKRGEIASGDVEARVQFLLLVRKAGPKGGRR